MDNLGDPLAEAEMLIASGRAREASRLVEGLHQSGRGGLLLQAARVRAFLALREAKDALVVAREVSSLYPNVAMAATLLGEALTASGLLAAAIGEFQRALRLDPGFVRARFELGCAWLEAGEAEKADEAFASIPDDDAPAALAEKRAEIARVQGRPRADARYVRHLFDQFSHDYDARMLGQLGYGAPVILRNLADLVGLTARGKLAVLDLGCGTGLAGAAFVDCARRLDGVDLSPAMNAKARARGIYDTLVIGDIEAPLSFPENGYDLIVAADTLVYLGDLTPLFGVVSAALAPDGAFLFTVERKDGEGFELGPKRRWRHSRSYLSELAGAFALDVAGILECEPRTEAGKPVDGFAVALTRTTV